MKITADTNGLVRSIAQDDPEQARAHQGLGPAKKAKHSLVDVTDISETPRGSRRKPAAAAAARWWCGLTRAISARRR